MTQVVLKGPVKAKILRKFLEREYLMFIFRTSKI